jgi:hypothetical protein
LVARAALCPKRLAQRTIARSPGIFGACVGAANFARRATFALSERRRVRTSAKPEASDQTPRHGILGKLNASAKINNDAFFSLGVSLAHDLACGFLGHQARLG